MTTRDYAAAVERTLLGMAWANHPDGDPGDPLALSPRLRMAAPDGWAAVADLLLLPGGRGGALLAEVRRLEQAQVGPEGGVLRAAGGPSEAWRALAAEVTRRRGTPLVRLAASTPQAAARYRSAPIDVEGVPGCTVSLSLEPTTDGVWMGILTRAGDDAEVEVVLTPQAGGPITLRLPTSLQSLVFYLEQDPGSAPHVWATGPP